MTIRFCLCLLHSFDDVLRISRKNLKGRHGIYRKILVPLDGSELAEVPLGYAIELSAKCQAKLILLHVFGSGQRHRVPESTSKPMSQRYIEYTAQLPRFYNTPKRMMSA